MKNCPSTPKMPSDFRNGNRITRRIKNKKTVCVCVCVCVRACTRACVPSCFSIYKLAYMYINLYICLPPNRD